VYFYNTAGVTYYNTLQRPYPLEGVWEDLAVDYQIGPNTCERLSPNVMLQPMVQVVLSARIVRRCGSLLELWEEHQVAPGMAVQGIWLREGTPISLGGRISETVGNGTYPGLIRSVLRVTAPSSADLGTYTFSLSNACGATATSVAVVQVCMADFNCSGFVSVQDIFDMLAAYFSGDSRADFNGSGTISVQDIFDLLAAFFAGCP
jgi:hypothetical protein